MLKSAVTVCSWSKSAPLVQLQFQLSCLCVLLVSKTTKKYSRLLQVLLRPSSISWQTSTKSMTTKSMLFNQWLKLTNGCKRNSQQVNRKNTENNVSINCLTVNSFLTWATNLPTVRRRQFSLDVSFAKFLKWL